MTRIQSVTVRITIETNKGELDDTIQQQDDESGDEFATRIALVLTALKELAAS